MFESAARLLAEARTLVDAALASLSVAVALVIGMVELPLVADVAER